VQFAACFWLFHDTVASLPAASVEFAVRMQRSNAHADAVDAAADKTVHAVVKASDVMEASVASGASFAISPARISLSHGMCFPVFSMLLLQVSIALRQDGICRLLCHGEIEIALCNNRIFGKVPGSPGGWHKLQCQAFNQDCRYACVVASNFREFCCPKTKSQE
jgi:hypothetical protein